MLDPFLVLVTDLLLESVFVIFVKIKISFREDGILFDYLVENVDVEGQSLCALQLLNQLPANGASHSVLVVELLDAVGAQSVATMNENARYSLSYVVLETAELAYV